MSDRMNKDTSAPARNTKVMNRFDLTKRLVAKLKHEEAVIAASATPISISGPPATARRIFTCWAVWAWHFRSRSA
jgi:hypothetical protein